MSEVKKLKIGNTSYDIVDSTAAHSLTDIAVAGSNIIFSSGETQDFDTTGNPTIIDNTISGLNYSNYISSPNALPSSGVFKFVINCTFSRLSDIQPLIAPLSDDYGLYVTSSSDPAHPNCLSFFDGVSSYNGTVQLSDSNKYWFGFTFNPSTLKLEAYQMVDSDVYTRETLPNFNNLAWTQVLNTTVLADKFSGNKIRLGSNGAVSSFYWNGSIYLPYTYISIDGTNFWSPIITDTKTIINATVPTITVDQTYNASSANAQSGVAINGAGFLKNTATGSNSWSFAGSSSAYGTGQFIVGMNSYATTGSNYSVVVGYNCGAGSSSIAIGRTAYALSSGSISIGYNMSQNVGAIGQYSICLGWDANANSDYGIAIGRSAYANATSAIQLGSGTNSTANTFNVGFYNGGTVLNYTMLNGATGLIPAARLGTLPAADGTYIPVLTITSGVPTITWTAYTP